MAPLSFVLALFAAVAVVAQAQAPPPPSGCPVAPAGTYYDLVPNPYLPGDSQWPADQPYTAPDVPVTYQMQSGPSYVPEQVAVFPAVHNSSAFFVQWVLPGTQDTTIPGSVSYGYSADSLTLTARATAHTYTYGAVGTAGYYVSGLIYDAVLPVEPSSTVYYQIQGLSTIFSFVTPPERGSYPFNLGLIADVGQTLNSSSTLSNVAASAVDFVIFGGDVCYADRYGYPCTAFNGTDIPMSSSSKTCGVGGLRWDSFFRLAQPLLSSKATAFIAGNHETEGVLAFQTLKPFIAYTARVPALLDSAPPSAYFSEYTSLSRLPYGGYPPNAPLFYSFEVGPAHIVGLSSYSPFNKYTQQWYWIQDDLCSINRAVTPWVIVFQHSPWYNTDKSHYREGETMRVVYEPFLFGASVDLVSSGHVHAYERSIPVYNYKYNQCGPTHVTVGDGGNSEGIAGPFLEPQPAYSVYREYSFGHAEINFENATQAVYSWFRNQDGNKVVGDSFQLNNLYSQCMAPYNITRAPFCPK